MGVFGPRVRRGSYLIVRPKKEVLALRCQCYQSNLFSNDSNEHWRGFGLRNEVE